MSNKGQILGGGGFMADGAPRYVLAMIDLDARTLGLDARTLGLDAPAPELEMIDLTFLPHGVVIDPKDPQRAAVFEKKGPGACIVDLKTRSVVRPIATPRSRRFYGHGAFSSDGSLLFATESLTDRSNEGVLVVRDAQTLKELGTLPTHGTAPHDCQLIDDGKIMVVANGGGDISGGAAASVTYVDLASERLLERIVLDSPRFNAGHVAVTSRGDIAVVSAPRDGLPTPNQQLGAVTMRPRGGSVTTVQQPHHVVSRMLGETLSVFVNEADRVVLASHPLGNCVSVWRLDDGAFIETLELSGPRGITMSQDGSWYLISHLAGNSVRLTAFAAATRKPVGFHVDPSFTSGSHVFMSSRA